MAYLGFKESFFFPEALRNHKRINDLCQKAGVAEAFLSSPQFMASVREVHGHLVLDATFTSKGIQIPQALDIISS